MKILIATGVYPPQLGGPSYYAKSLKEEFERLSHEVTVKTFTVERSLPTGIRHLYYLLKTVGAFVRADLVLVFDTFSVGLPIALMQEIFRRDVIVRVGGDFLWEIYTERTKEKILLSEFYNEPRQFSFKERMIRRATEFVMRAATQIVFNTTFQRDIWVDAYTIGPKKVTIIENRYEPMEKSYPAEGKTFVYAAARPLVWKNGDTAREAIAIAQKTVPSAQLIFLFDLPRDEAIERIKASYACVLTSFGDLSPNYILRALSCGKPVILAAEIGIRDRIGDIAMYVDPKDPAAIARGMVAMSDEKTYAEYRRRVASFMYTHTYADIAREFLALTT